MTISSDGLVKVTGNRALTGRYPVQGSKNIALHLYAAALLADTPLVLVRAPDIVDTGVCAQILRHIGVGAMFDRNQFMVSPAETLRPVVPYELGRQIRTTAVLASAVLARAGQVTFPYPGGDAFCPRLIDRHLAAMRAAGAEVVSTPTELRVLSGRRGLRAFTVDVNTPYGPSLGATVTAVLLAARIPGASLITSPSIEPEVIETCRFLAVRASRSTGTSKGYTYRGVTGSTAAPSRSWATASRPPPSPWRLPRPGGAWTWTASPSTTSPSG